MVYHMGRAKPKGILEYVQNTFRFNPHNHKLSSGHLLSILILFIVPNDSVSGQRRPWSDCADAQAVLGLRCPHMPEDTCSRGAANMTASPTNANSEISTAFVDLTKVFADRLKKSCIFGWSQCAKRRLIRLCDQSIPWARVCNKVDFLTWQLRLFLFLISGWIYYGSDRINLKLGLWGIREQLLSGQACAVSHSCSTPCKQRGLSRKFTQQGRIQNYLIGGSNFEGCSIWSNYRTNIKYWDRLVWANSVDPDQTPQNAASDQSLPCLPLIKASKMDLMKLLKYKVKNKIDFIRYPKFIRFKLFSMKMILFFS